jgi:hypothetical protein
MSGGAISGNTITSSSSAYGGGVYSYGTFTMSGGEISGNTASGISDYYVSSGGGVYVSSSGTFTKQSDGTIYGANADSSLRNTASSGIGHAVYVSSSPEKIRTTTAGVGVTLDRTVDGADGGWEPTWGSIQIDFNDPQLYEASLWVNQSVVFDAGTNYASWTWYWDGELLNGESSSTYTLTADKSRTPGVYELSVVVVSNTGGRLSARCRVVVKTH